MLKRKYRLNKTRDLQKLYRIGRPLHAYALVIKFVPGNQTKIAFVVSKRISKKAVERNRIKRVLREEMRLRLNTLQRGAYLVAVKGAAASLANNELRKELDKALKKANRPVFKPQKPLI